MRLVTTIAAIDANSQIHADILEFQLERFEVLLESVELPETAYLLEQAVHLESGQYGPDSFVDVTYITDVSETGGYSYRWLPEEHPISPVNGVGHVTVDARDINSQLTSEDLLRRLLGPSYTDPVISNSRASLRILRDLSVAQGSAAESTLDLYSHKLTYLHSFEHAGFSYRTISTLVFADRPVSISATGSSGMSLEADIHLAAGWNVVYREYDFETDYLYARPFRSNEIPEARDYFHTVAQGLIDPAVEAVAMYPTHELAGGAADSLWSGSLQNPDHYWQLQVPGWIHPDDEVLVPIADAFGAESFTSVGEERADLAVTLGRFLAYDDMASYEWANNPGEAIGQLGILSEDGNTVLLLYANQDAHLDFGMTQDGTTVTTSDDGLQLLFGWNRLELVPELEADSFTIREYPYFWEADTTFELY